MRAFFASLAVLALTSCWQARQREPLDLGDQTTEVAATIESLRRLDAGVDGELALFAERVDAFFGTPTDLWAPPFPLDAFKHTAMSCLNAPYDENAPEPHVQEVADRLGLRCAVAAAVHLDEQLSPATRRDEALGKLREIDDLRHIRADLQTKLRQLPSILRRTRSFVSTRRAEARQISVEVRARETEYGRKSYTESLRELERYEAQLAALEGELTALDEGAGQWSTRLAAVVDRLYMDLSRLGPP